ncbi:hypothetical protein [Microbacterium sp. IEGM 1404]|uniref:hypothetical protein n=1 Tax=Microbacterium sp. IEGM 1404 TaxID=3047084 RepID=UPI0024B7113A|nr:hypothetical protein [Microbacterium sp. IEGM 1404]MDI9890380.1 hypothetical protein [Microbacterium sp. IEGM 1404]
MTAGLLGGILFLAGGIVAYTGTWKGWIRVRRGFGATIGFAWLWIGLALLVGAAALLVESASRPAFFVLIGVAAVLLSVGAVGLFWLPRFLLPAWFRVLRGDDARPRGRA